MTEEEKLKLYSETDELLDIFKEFSPIQDNGTYVLEAVKPCFTEMINYIIKNKTESAALCDWLDESDFWTAPASSRFHGDFKGGLSIHSLMVVRQSLVFTKPLMENFLSSPIKDRFVVSAYDVFISALCHDFCKTGFYTTEFRNTKDINGNWIKQPFFKTKSDNRNLGHGNESVLKMLEIFPSLIKNRTVLEAVSRHMGFSDLTDTEQINYSNFLENPLVLLLQLADQSAANWYNA